MANPGEVSQEEISCWACGEWHEFTVEPCGGEAKCGGCGGIGTITPKTEHWFAPAPVPPPPLAPVHTYPQIRIFSNNPFLPPGLGPNSVARGRPSRHWRPGDIIPGRQCSRCKNESIRIESMSEREVEDPSHIWAFTLTTPTKTKVLDSVKVSCRLCGSDSGTIQAQDLPSA